MKATRGANARKEATKGANPRKGVKLRQADHLPPSEVEDWLKHLADDARPRFYSVIRLKVTLVCRIVGPPKVTIGPATARDRNKQFRPLSRERSLYTLSA